MIHELKTWPEPFAAILDGRKRFEIRKADRPFAVGDVLHLREWIPCPGAMGSVGFGDYTGHVVRASVTYLVPGGDWGLPADLCVMGIAPQPGREAPCPDCAGGGIKGTGYGHEYTCRGTENHPTELDGRLRATYI